MSTVNVSNFSTDLIFGQEGEQLVEELLTGGRSVEVKRDAKWVKTGNLYIETECYYRAKNAWGPSGVTTTRADYWAFVLEDMVLIAPTAAVRYAVDEFGSPIACNIEPNPSKGYLITVPHLLKSIKEYKNA